MRITILTLLLAFLAGCGAPDSLETTAPETIETPPSLQAGSTSTRMITLTARQQEELHIETWTVALESASFDLKIPGEVDASPEHYAEVSAPISGRVARIMAHEGERVQQGDVLLEMESLGFADLVADYLEARAELTYAESEQSRLEQLVDRGISPVRVLEKARADLSRAETRVSANWSRLRAVGVTEDEMASWSTTSRERPVLRILAPISGFLDQHNVDTGKAVDENESLLTIVDPTTVLVRGYAPPEEASLLHPGEAVTIRPRQESGVSVSSTITTVNPSVDPDNRSVVLNIKTPTSNGWPRPGESVQVIVTAISPQPVLSVPLEAIQYEGQEAVVFVAHDASTYERRPVSLLRVNATTAFVEDGLEAGEAVAITQVFTLKALSRFDLFGEE
jgi:cobalt-zinc-cadmium efflux system membrane fusion protein